MTTGRAGEGGGRPVAPGRSGDRGTESASVWTDGACLGNPGPGGWAWALPGGAWASGAEPATTNQRMELRAALEALLALPGVVEVVSDSTYVVNCFRQRWWVGWERRGWRNAKNEPVANQDLWRPLLETALPRGIEWRWVKGHAGNAMNELVDRLANEAARTGRGRSSTGSSTGTC